MPPTGHVFRALNYLLPEVGSIDPRGSEEKSILPSPGSATQIRD